MKEKVILAYSGGLDTSAIIPWLKENYGGCEVVDVAEEIAFGKEIAAQQVPIGPHVFHSPGALIAHQMILVGVGIIV